MGIGEFIRKYDKTCDCNALESLGEDLAYITIGRPAHTVYFQEHFITEMRKALQYDKDEYGRRRFYMSKPEFNFWSLFEGTEYSDAYDPGAPLKGTISGSSTGNETLRMAIKSLDNWLHREIQNLPHEPATKLDPEKCESVTKITTIKVN
jgi:hypothetical protein